MMDLVCGLARRAAALDRVTALHCALGEAEWPGTVELAELHARRYGMRFEVRSRPQSLLAQVEARHVALGEGQILLLGPASSRTLALTA